MSDADFEVVRFYTKARRFPQLIGKTPDGARLPGGPYTYTQVLGTAAFVLLATRTTALWAQFGLIGNAFVLVGATAALLWGLGRLPAGARNPASIASSTWRAFTAPPTGRYQGRPLTPRRARRARRARLLITPHPASTTALTPPMPVVLTPVQSTLMQWGER